jgi:hypothetical protein
MGIRGRGRSQQKTLGAIRGSGVRSNERHVHQFQIALLELERTRRTRERQVALDRVQRLDTRLEEIEATIRKHQEALGIPGASREEPAAGEPRPTLRY